MRISPTLTRYSVRFGSNNLPQNPPANKEEVPSADVPKKSPRKGIGAGIPILGALLLMGGFCGGAGVLMHRANTAAQTCLKATPSEKIFNGMEPEARAISSEGIGFVYPDGSVRECMFNKQVGHFEERDGKLFVHSDIIKMELGYADKDGNIYAKPSFVPGFIASQIKQYGVTEDENGYLKIAKATEAGTVFDFTGRPIGQVNELEGKDLSVQEIAATAILTGNWKAKS